MILNFSQDEMYPEKSPQMCLILFTELKSKNLRNYSEVEGRQASLIFFTIKFNILFLMVTEKN